MSRKAKLHPLLALTPPGQRTAVARAAEAARLDVVMVGSLPDLLSRLAESTWSVTLVSLSVEHVDEAIVRRVAEQTGAGEVLVSASAASLERALALKAMGIVGILREPLIESELRERLLGLVDEGRPVPLPPWTASASTAEVDAAPVLVGESPAMGAVFDLVARVAASGTTVLLTGESGTGKEVVARALHWASERSAGPFVPVNCAAIPENLLETELFGHERGAFTGAVARRVGRFERAHGGTLFLDEIGDMSLVLQAKVLRVLEDRTVERVGGEESRTIDVRVVAATNQDLAVATREGRFREDLYHRLAVVELQLPPLRERGADVRALALHFAADFAKRHGKPVSAISERALSRLESAPWPGNVRELRNVMDRAVVLTSGSTIRSDALRLGANAPVASAHAGALVGPGYATSLSLAEVEADHIRRVLAAVGGHIVRAAETLGIHRNTLARKMRELGVDEPVEATSP